MMIQNPNLHGWGFIFYTALSKVGSTQTILACYAIYNDLKITDRYQ